MVPHSSLSPPTMSGSRNASARTVPNLQIDTTAALMDKPCMQMANTRTVRVHPYPSICRTPKNHSLCNSTTSTNSPPLVVTTHTKKLAPLRQYHHRYETSSSSSPPSFPCSNRGEAMMRVSNVYTSFRDAAVPAPVTPYDDSFEDTVREENNALKTGRRRWSLSLWFDTLYRSSTNTDTTKVDINSNTNSTPTCAVAIVDGGRGCSYDDDADSTKQRPSLDYLINGMCKYMYGMVVLWRSKDMDRYHQLSGNENVENSNNGLVKKQRKKRNSDSSTTNSNNCCRHHHRRSYGSTDWNKAITMIPYDLERGQSVANGHHHHNSNIISTVPPTSSPSLLFFFVLGSLCMIVILLTVVLVIEAVDPF